MNLRKTVAQMGVALGIAVLIAGFHNCAQPVRSQSDAKASLTANNGNGVGYDGKTIFQNLLSNGVCADGSNVNSQIELATEVYYLVRESCHDITARVLNASDVVIPQGNSSVVIYLNQMFQQVKAGAAGSTAFCMDMLGGFNVMVMPSPNGPTATFAGAAVNSGIFPVAQTNGANSITFDGTDGGGDVMQLSVQNGISMMGTYSGSVTITWGAAYRAAHPGVTAYQQSNLMCYR